MTRTHLGLALLLPWLVLAGGLAVLLTRRRRSPRAAVFAAPVLAVLAVAAAYPSLRALGFWTVPPGVDLWRYRLLPLAGVVGWVLLPVAAMMDRQPGEAGER